MKTPCVSQLSTMHLSRTLEHLHQCSGCDPALEILDEVHQSNPVNLLLLEDCWDPEIFLNLSVQSPGGVLEQSNKHNPIVLIDCSLFLIG